MEISCVAHPQKNLCPKNTVHIHCLQLRIAFAGKQGESKVTLSDPADVYFENKSNARFNELGRVCCVVPGGLLRCTEVSLCRLPFPVSLCD